ncbi:hypothetical protein DE146DRAFT_16398 [Phaeosphaeria sp. MPI-PUGE-AT-0046c]|nr:hypothetical protein DE146DRAFT_16398 [Phaeosphaeria sp. MPI-PUGE-AT-0046c]
MVRLGAQGYKLCSSKRASVVASAHPSWCGALLVLHGNIIFPPPMLLALTVTTARLPIPDTPDDSAFTSHSKARGLSVCLFLALCVLSVPTWQLDSLVTPGPSLASPTLHTRFRYAARSQRSTTRRYRPSLYWPENPLVPLHSFVSVANCLHSLSFVTGPLLD